MKDATSDYIVRPYKEDQGEIRSLELFMREHPDLEMMSFGDLCVVILPKKRKLSQDLKAFAFTDIDDTVSDSTSGLTATLEDLGIPDTQSQRVYDIARRKLFPDSSKSVFDPYLTAAVVRQFQMTHHRIPTPGEIRKSVRLASRIGTVELPVVPPDSRWVPDAYPHAEAFLEAVGEFCGMSPVALTRGAYVAQAEKTVSLIERGLLSGAIITKSSKNRLMTYIHSHASHPLAVVLRQMGLNEDTPVLMASEDVHDIERVLQACDNGVRSLSGILLDNPSAWYTRERIRQDYQVTDPHIRRISFLEKNHVWSREEILRILLGSDLPAHSMRADAEVSSQI